MVQPEQQPDDLRGQLFAVLISVRDRLSERDAQLIHEFIDVGELGLVLEQMIDDLSEGESPISDNERTTMHALSRDMQMGQRVPETLELCPSRR